MELDSPLIPRVVQRLQAVADENRIRLLLLLRDQPADVSTLTAKLGLSQASVSKHLAVLREAGLLRLRRAGARSIYSIRDESIFDLCRIVCDGVVRFLEQEHAALNLAVAK